MDTVSRQPCFLEEKTSRKFLFDFLLQIDRNGNTILHLLVIHNLPKIYTKFKERWLKAQAIATDELSDEDESDNRKEITSTRKREVPPWKKLNKDGFTPLTLAAKLGVTDMFSFLLDECKLVQWRYGPVSCVLYPLDELELEFQEEVSILLPSTVYLVRHSFRTEIQHMGLLN